MDPDVGVVGQEAGPGEILSRRIDAEIVGGPDVGGDGLEPLLMGADREVDGDDPFESVARRGDEEQHGVETGIVEQAPLQRFDTGEVVEIDRDQAGVFQQAVVGAFREGAREGDVIEVAGLEKTGLSPIGHRAQLLGDGLKGGPADEAVDIDQSELKRGACVLDGAFEIADQRRVSFLFDFGQTDLRSAFRLFRSAFPGMGINKMKLPDQLPKQLIFGQVIEMVSECEGVAGKLSVAAVGITEEALLAGDVEGFGTTQKRIPGGLTMVAYQVKHQLAGVVLLQDVAVDEQPVVRLAEDLALIHGVTD